jgi:hypothetical protein
MSGYPAMGGVTTQRSNASSLMALPAELIFFRLVREAFSGLYLFEPFEVFLAWRLA